MAAPLGLRRWAPVVLVSLALVPSAFAASAPADPKIVHLLNRLSFGPAPGDIEQATRLGIERYIQQQLHPEQIAEPPALNARLAALDTLKLAPVELARAFGPRPNGANRRFQAAGAAPQLDEQQRQDYRQNLRLVVEQAATARLMQALSSPRQLQEVMTDFWFNHFNVYAGKGLTRLWVGAYEQEAIRPYALGRFRDLLAATAAHPAMLFYLDNWLNTGPATPGARGRFTGLNENYARELLELHTLGVDGGYSQQDVTELARIFTGWGLCRPRRDQPLTGFCFDARRHAPGDKILLGQTIRESGMDEGLQALDLLSRHPATARHISFQLAQYFVADNPPAGLVERLAERFRASDGDIRAVLDALFHSPEFWDSRNFASKFKTPYRYVLSAVRATGIEPANPLALFAPLQQLGMPLYGCQTPDGYKNTRESWLNPDGMTRRLSFAASLANGQLAGTRPGGETTATEALIETLGGRFSAKTRAALAKNPEPLRSALLLGSPEMMAY
ncbi:DUF1800 domain-containing protein [Gloeobacter kilaueensis]|uniref:DUF1800 domain-containing protein n=1 Tax=Gloeobacter kilaueensis (strain ATCC BAA-2537 / CCAP 1431/1 / ULC 316 / JS1) TaxID=1183438 RepID=U5QJ59_GLOK1|nr:DUF1800 domain-containing protein [Gloeobacter kilaueensis]AGY58893.1 hypothetical protein GKIL_2647 [Gloeobacter kilaueensis JS1]